MLCLSGLCPWLLSSSHALAGWFPSYNFFLISSLDLFSKASGQCFQLLSWILHPQASYMQTLKIQLFIFPQNLLPFPQILSQKCLTIYLPHYPTSFGSIPSSLPSDQLPSPSLPLGFHYQGSGLGHFSLELLQKPPIFISDSSCFFLWSIFYYAARKIFLKIII